MKHTKMMAAVLLSAAMACTAPAAVMAEDAASIEALESENAQLKEQVETLESENAQLKETIEALQGTEKETEQQSTEVVGTVYTDAAIVKAVQKALNEAGYDCGTPDGKAGSKTNAAIKSYQAEKKINVNGVITDELIEALGISDQIEEAAKQEAMMKEYSSEYTYTQVARDPDSYAGDKMKFRGKVLQEGDAGSGMRYIRLAVNSDYDAVLFVTYTKDIVDMKILDDDIITIYGSCIGDYTYETVMGASITLPWVNADIIDMSEVSTS